MTQDVAPDEMYAALMAEFQQMTTSALYWKARAERAEAALEAQAAPDADAP